MIMLLPHFLCCERAQRGIQTYQMGSDPAFDVPVMNGRFGKHRRLLRRARTEKKRDEAVARLSAVDTRFKDPTGANAYRDVTPKSFSDPHSSLTKLEVWLKSTPNTDLACRECRL